MTVIAACLYRGGRRHTEFNIADDVLAGANPNDFVWIGVCDPTDQEMAILQSRYGLHPIAVDASMDADQTPRLEVVGRVRQGGVISAVAVGHRQAALAVMCRG